MRIMMMTKRNSADRTRLKDMRDMKRLGRYLVGRERVQVTFERHDRCSVIDIWTDTDYAGCLDTRKSTSGGLVLI